MGSFHTRNSGTSMAHIVRAMKKEHLSFAEAFDRVETHVETSDLKCARKCDLREMIDQIFDYLWYLVEPTDRRQQLLALACRKSPRSFERVLILQARNLKSEYTLSWFTRIIADDRIVLKFSRRPLLDLALIGDFRFARVFDQLAAAGRSDAKDHADALRVLGAVRQILANDSQSFMRLWARANDACGESFDHLDGLNHTDDEINVEALLILENNCRYLLRCGINYISDMEVLTRLVRALKTSVKPVRDRFKGLKCLLHLVPEENRLVRRNEQMGRALDTIADVWKDNLSLYDRIYLFQKIEILMLFSPVRDSLQKYTVGLFKNVPLAELVGAGHDIISAMYESCVQWYWSCARNGEECGSAERVILILLAMGAGVQPWFDDQVRAVRNAWHIGQPSLRHMAKLTLNSICPCLGQEVRIDHIPDLRCLAAGAVKCLPKDFNPRIAIRHGGVKIPLKPFIDAHEKLEYDREISLDIFNPSCTRTHPRRGARPVRMPFSEF